MEINLLLRGIIFGLAIAAPVGPIGVLCIRQTLTFGWLRGFVCGLGAATADAIYGYVAGFGLNFISDFLLERQIWLRLIGGAFLCYLGIKTFVRIQIKPHITQIRDMRLASVYISTLLLTLTNPATILTFAAIFSGTSAISIQGNYFLAILLVAGVFLGSALWWLLLSGSITVVKNKLVLTNFKWSDRISGLIITALGLMTLLGIS